MCLKIGKNCFYINNENETLIFKYFDGSNQDDGENSPKIQ